MPGSFDRTHHHPAFTGWDEALAGAADAGAVGIRAGWL